VDPDDTAAPTPASRPRAPKPSKRLDADTRRILGLLLARVDIEQLAAMASQSESTIRRFGEGATGARASVRMLSQAVVVAVCEHAPDLIATEGAALRRIARESTPGGVGLDLPALVPPPEPEAPAPRDRRKRQRPPPPPRPRFTTPIVGNDAAPPRSGV
jgi:hypothetical protein